MKRSRPGKTVPSPYDVDAELFGEFMRASLIHGESSDDSEVGHASGMHSLRDEEVLEGVQRALDVVPICAAKFHLARCTSQDLGGPAPIGLVQSLAFSLRAEILSDEWSRLSELGSASEPAKAARKAKLARLAKGAAQSAISIWPCNGAAVLTLATLAKNNSDLTQAANHFLSVVNMNLSSVDEFQSEQDQGNGWNWRQELIEEPHHRFLRAATYQAAIVLSQLDRHDEARDLVARLGCAARIAPGVWRQAAAAPNQEKILQVPSSFATTRETTSLQSPAWFCRDVVPGHLLHALRHAFRPGSPYWRETSYENRGYFSWWCPLVDKKTSNHLVEELILLLLKKLGPLAKQIVGAEWWVHRRPVGKRLGHALHFDTDEVAVELENQVAHPLVSSVCYLEARTDVAARAGATVVFDGQRVGSENFAKRAFVIHPQDSCALFFDGSLLHGVLPGNPSLSNPQPDRLTLMVGFWASDRCLAPKHRVGPCAPLPRATRQTSWINELEPKADPNEANPSVNDDAASGGISIVSPAWEPVDPLPEHDTARIEIPWGIDQRFFVKDAMSFTRALHEKM